MPDHLPDNFDYGPVKKRNAESLKIPATKKMKDVPLSNKITGTSIEKDHIDFSLHEKAE